MKHHKKTNLNDGPSTAADRDFDDEEREADDGRVWVSRRYQDPRLSYEEEGGEG